MRQDFKDVGSGIDEGFAVELLEPRLLLSGTHYVVDTLVDVVADDGLISLREAILAANTNAVVNDAAAGSSTAVDSISFHLGIAGPTASITLISYPYRPLEITDSLDIQGPGEDLLTIGADAHITLLNVKGDHTQVNISDLTLAGGGLKIDNRSESLTLTNVSILGQAVDPYDDTSGGISSTGGDLTLINSSVMNNINGDDLSSDAGGIDFWGGGTLTIIDSVISGNDAGRYEPGGGIEVGPSSTLIMSGSTVSGNTAVDFPGLALYGTSMITDSVITQNYGSFSGGGIANGGDLTITDSYVTGNYVFTLGGGIYNHGGSVTVNNTVITGNRCYDGGGGIFNRDGSVMINNSTITHNQVEWTKADAGSGIFNQGSLEVNNSIVALNQSPQSFDIVGNYEGRNNIIGIDPIFVRNPDDGGDGFGRDINTFGVYGIDESVNDDFGDLRLQLISPAVNAGDDEWMPESDFDLDGNARVFGISVDVGAYELEYAVDYVVDSLLDVVADDGVLTLREAIEAANTNVAVFDAPAGSAIRPDVITFDPELAGGTILLALNQSLQITDSVMIVGLGEDLLTIEGGGEGRYIDDKWVSHFASVFEMTGEQTETQLSYMTITGGRGSYGGGVYHHSKSLLMTNVTVTDNGSLLEHETAGGIYSSGRFTLVNSTVSNNRTDHHEMAGGIYAGGVVSIVNSVISNNEGGFESAGIDAGGTVTIVNTIISDNSGGNYGGMHLHGIARIIDSTISNNSGSSGGGIGVGYSASATIVDSIISGNEGHRGGGIVVSPTALLVMLGSDVYGNLSSYGGGIYIESNYEGNTFVLLTNSAIFANRAYCEGGGIYHAALNDSTPHLTITNCTIAYNSANEWPFSNGTESRGGGIYNNGDMTLINTIVALNEATTSGDDIEGTYRGHNNLVGVDPLFVRAPGGYDLGFGDDLFTPDIDESADDDYGDLRLLSGSPAIDAGLGYGNDLGLYVPMNDRNHTWRYDDPAVENTGVGQHPWYRYTDIGVYEARYTLPLVNADFDGDDAVGLMDLDILGSYFGANEGVTKNMGDADGDGVVGLLDLDILGRTWGASEMKVAEGSVVNDAAMWWGLGGEDRRDVGFEFVSVLEDSEEEEVVVLF